MNAQYMNAPLQQPQLAHNQFKLPHQQPQPPQPPILESLLEGNFQNVYERVMGGNVVQEGIDALQAHINKTKVFQAMHQRAPVEEKYIPRGLISAFLPLLSFFKGVVSTSFPRTCRCSVFSFHFMQLSSGVAAPGVPNVVDNRINMYNNQYSPTAVISFSLVNTTEFSAKVRFQPRKTKKDAPPKTQVFRIKYFIPG